MTHLKIKETLDLMNTVQEQLLSLADDIHLSIDPRDKDSIKKGYEFLSGYSEQLTQFTESSNVLEEQIKNFFGINPETEDIVKIDSIRNVTERERIIKELDKTKAYSLDENFTFKRPYGFVLGNTAIKGLKTWKSLYVNLLSTLYESDKVKFKKLTSEPKFVSNRGNFYFHNDKSVFRVYEKVAGGFYAEVNLSANHIKNVIIDLLVYFKIEVKSLKIYLREDRDA
ncbi:MAG: hypothetical protein PHT69_16065 [Bacteroidales bacterium]|nr:hypothetical protein [Bacteroidales bacterium]